MLTMQCRTISSLNISLDEVGITESDDDIKPRTFLMQTVISAIAVDKMSILSGFTNAISKGKKCGYG